MSTHGWNTSDGWTVRTGWVAGLGHYHLSIGRKCASCDGRGTNGQDEATVCTTCRGSGDEYLFDNSTERPGPYGAMRDLDDVLQTLADYGVPRPPDLEMNLLVDALTDSEERTKYDTLERPAMLIAQANARREEHVDAGEYLRGKADGERDGRLIQQPLHTNGHTYEAYRAIRSKYESAIDPFTLHSDYDLGYGDGVDAVSTPSREGA